MQGFNSTSGAVGIFACRELEQQLMPGYSCSSGPERFQASIPALSQPAGSSGLTKFDRFGPDSARHRRLKLDPRYLSLPVRDKSSFKSLSRGEDERHPIIELRYQRAVTI